MIQLHLSTWVGDLYFNAPRAISVAPRIFIILSYIKQSAWEYLQKAVDYAYGLALFTDREGLVYLCALIGKDRISLARRSNLLPASLIITRQETEQILDRFIHSMCWLTLGLLGKQLKG